MTPLSARAARWSLAVLALLAAPAAAQNSERAFGPWRVGCLADIMTDRVTCWMRLPLGSGAEESGFRVTRVGAGREIWLVAPSFLGVAEALIRYDRNPPMTWPCSTADRLTSRFTFCRPIPSEHDAAAAALDAVSSLAVRLVVRDGHRDHVIPLTETARAYGEYTRLSEAAARGP